MHKEEASKLFGLLANDLRVKAIKMLYVKGGLSTDSLKDLLGLDLASFNDLMKPLIENNLVSFNENTYLVNKVLVDDLMTFVTRPCNCTQ